MKVAIATTCFTPIGGFWGVTWSLTKTATVAKNLGADGIGAYPLRGATAYRGHEELSVPILFVGEDFGSEEPGLLDRLLFPDQEMCDRFLRWATERLGVPIETHDPVDARKHVVCGREAWMETIPEKGLNLQDHLQVAVTGAFYLSVDNWDVQGRHGLTEPFGDPVKAMETFLNSGRVRNIHAQPTHREVPLILRDQGNETILAALLKVVKGWNEDILITLEVNPLGVWRTDPLAILPGRYLKRLEQLLAWVRAQVS